MSKRSLWVILCIAIFLITGFFGCSSKKDGTKVKQSVTLTNKKNETIDKENDIFAYKKDAIVTKVDDTVTISDKKNFEDLTKIDKNNITKVFIRDGMTGDSIVINDNTQIHAAIKILDNVNYSKSLNQEIRSGYSYFADFYSGENKLARITLYGNNSIEVNESMYDMDRVISNYVLKIIFNSFTVAKWPAEAK